MLDAIPEDQALTQLIIIQLATYHDKCLAWYTGKGLRPSKPSIPFSPKRFEFST